MNRPKINLIAKMANEHIAASIIRGDQITVDEAVTIALGVYEAAEDIVENEASYIEALKKVKGQ